MGACKLRLPSCECGDVLNIKFMQKDQLLGEPIIGYARNDEPHPHKIMVNPNVKLGSGDGEEVAILPL